MKKLLLIALVLTATTVLSFPVEVSAGPLRNFANRVRARRSGYVYYNYTYFNYTGGVVQGDLRTRNDQSNRVNQRFTQSRNGR